MPTERSSDKLQKEKLNSLSLVMKDSAYQAKEYNLLMSKITRLELAYFVDSYTEKNTMELFWAVEIFNTHAKDIGLETAKDFKEIMVLSKQSDLYKKEKEEYPEYRHPDIPVYFLHYIQDYWVNAISALRCEWEPDVLDLSIMVLTHQHNNQYKSGWVKSLLKFFYDGNMPADISRALVEAQELIDDGEFVKLHRNFHKLITISISEYRTRMLIGSINSQAEDVALKDLYFNSKNSAEKKLKAT